MNLMQAQVRMVLACLFCACWLAQGAPNDYFAGAIRIQGPSAQVSGNNTAPNPPELTDPYPDLTSESSYSVWWKWQSPTNGQVTIDTLGSENGYNTRLMVYQGTTLGALTPVANGDNDDYGGTLQSLVTINVTSGTEYRIVVDGEDGGGQILLTLLCASVPAPTNGTFASRTQLSGLSAAWTGSNSNSVSSTEQGWLAPLWWKWTAPKSCVMEVDTRGSGIDTVIGVYTGGLVNALTMIATTNLTRRLWWTAEEGKEYQIAVDGVNRAWGDILLNLQEVSPPVIAGVGVGSVTWGSLTGESYRVWCSTNLSDWVVATSRVASATATVISFANAPMPRAFYRVERYLP